MRPHEITTDALAPMSDRSQRFSAKGAFHTSLGHSPRFPGPQKSGALKGRSIPPIGPSAGAPHPPAQAKGNCSAGGVDYSPANNTFHASPRCAPREVSSFPGDAPMNQDAAFPRIAQQASGQLLEAKLLEWSREQESKA
jgi:hypothetical protein